MDRSFHYVKIIKQNSRELGRRAIFLSFSLSLNCFSYVSWEVRQDPRSVLSWASLPSLCFRAIRVVMLSRTLVGRALGIWVFSPSKHSVSLPSSERCMPPAPSSKNIDYDNDDDNIIIINNINKIPRQEIELALN